MLLLDPIRRKAQQWFVDRLCRRPVGPQGDGASMVLVLDRSGSMAGRCGRLTKLDAAREAAAALLAARQRMGMQDQMAVIAFNHEAQLLVPPVPVPEFESLIVASLYGLQTSGGTDLACGLELIWKQIHRPDHVILLTDGQGGDPTVAADRLKAQGTVIETVGVADTPQEVDESVLRRTASVWQGEVLYRFIRDGRQVIRYFQTELATRLVKR